MSEALTNDEGSATNGGSGAGSSATNTGPSLKGDGLDAAEALKIETIGPFPDYGGCELRLVNMTATAYMGCTIDLRKVVTRARNAEYNPKRFSACVSPTQYILLERVFLRELLEYRYLALLV